MGEPNDIAYGILYLASDEAKFITGSELVIDGGATQLNKYNNVNKLYRPKNLYYLAIQEV